MGAIHSPKKDNTEVVQAVMALTIFVIIPLIAIAHAFYQEKNERISCSTLSSYQIKFLNDSGAILPAECLAPGIRDSTE